MKLNFICPRCKKPISVGKHLHASFKCPNCKAEMVIGYDERMQGYLNKKRNFFKFR